MVSHSRLTLLALCLIVAALTGPRADSEITIDAACERLGLDEQQLADVKAGKIVSVNYEELTDKELAIGMVMIVKAPLPEVMSLILESKVLEIGKDLLDFKRLGDKQPTDEDFADLELDEAEIRKLLHVKAGSEYNLSASEIERFQALGESLGRGCEKKPECAAEVMAEYRQVLRERLESYRGGGLAAIAPYARGGKKLASPGEELKTATEDPFLVKDRRPDLYKAVVNYPSDPFEGIEHRFSWLKLKVQGRPAVVLVHRMVLEEPELGLALERQFYASHDYNSGLASFGCFAVQDQTMVFYTNRTSTDQVEGFAQDMRHSIGRKQMRAEILATFEDARAKLQGP